MAKDSQQSRHETADTGHQLNTKPQKPDQSDALAELSRDYCIVQNVDGQPKVIYKPGGREPMSKRSFLEAFEYLPPIEILTPEGDTKFKPAAQVWWMDAKTERYPVQVFNPAEGPSFTNESGVVMRNSYRQHREPPTKTVIKEDIAPWMEILDANYPEPSDQQIILTALAFAIQRPADLLRWAIVLQGAEGCGKGTILEPLEHALGDNLGSVKKKNLTEQFNGYALKKTAIICDEIGQHPKATIAEIAEELKVPITQSKIPIRKMRSDVVKADNYAVWFFMTNFQDSMFVNKNTRRWAPFISTIQTEEEVKKAFPGKDLYWLEFYDWYHREGADLIHGYLAQYPLPNPMPVRAPETSTKAEAIAAGESEALRAIREFIEDNKRLAVFKDEIATHLEAEGVKVPNGRWFGETMKSAGFPIVDRVMRDKTKVRAYARDQQAMNDLITAS